MNMDQKSLPDYGKHPAHDAGVAKMAQLMKDKKQALINFDFKVPDNFSLPSRAHILHFVFVKVKPTDEARAAFNSFCVDLGELTQGDRP
jgi:hypothetical protein